MTTTLPELLDRLVFLEDHVGWWDSHRKNPDYSLRQMFSAAEEFLKGLDGNCDLPFRISIRGSDGGLLLFEWSHPTFDEWLMWVVFKMDGTCFFREWNHRDNERRNVCDYTNVNFAGGTLENVKVLQDMARNKLARTKGAEC